jgi:hypothetical protein
VGFGFLLVLSSRIGWHKYVGRQRLKGRLRFRTLIVGTNGEAAGLVEVLKRPASGFEPIGVAATALQSVDVPRRSASLCSAGSTP